MLPLLLALLATTPQPVPGEPAALAPPVWCADGRLAAYCQLPGEALWLRFDLAGGEPAVLRPSPAPEAPRQLFWSPRGTAWAYAAKTPQGRLLYLQALGEAAEPLALLGPISPLLVDWSPDGSRLAFARVADPGAPLPYEILVLGADGSGPYARVGCSSPPRTLRLAPDNDRFAYLMATAGRQCLYVASAAAGAAVLCSQHLEVVPQTVEWSPDSRYVSFAGSADLTLGARCYVSRADGRAPAQALASAGYLGEPGAQWSAEGTWIAWIAGTAGRPDLGRLLLASRDAVDRPQRPQGLSRCSRPRFNAAGTWLAALLHGGSDSVPPEVVLLRPTATAPEARFSAPGGLCEPVFSPDGRRLAMITWQGSPRRLYTVDLPLPSEAPPG
ncbi:MAG: PD40 domain-containing protein [Fimbriimonadaceae bacterium]|nr:PD40 domain-containing protein [Fimbriimonadaceae bacterium]